MTGGGRSLPPNLLAFAFSGGPLAGAATFLSSRKLPSFLPLAGLLPRFLLLLANLLLSFLFPPPFPHDGPSRADADQLCPAPPPEASAPARALAHVLAVVTRVPVASRKYDLVRSLADHLLDDNLRLDAAPLADLNRAALADAFSRTLRLLEAAAGAASGSMELVLQPIRRWWPPPSTDRSGAPPAEKLAAELFWLAEKMAECGAAPEAVALWGGAGGLGRRALDAEPRLQAALLRIAVFLFNRTNSKDFDEHFVSAADSHRVAMLNSWLPLLCRVSNGEEAPAMTAKEKAEAVRAVEEAVDKLDPEDREKVLALWLQHFAMCPDSDWPNLEGCYTRWYVESRRPLLEKTTATDAGDGDGGHEDKESSSGKVNEVWGCRIR